MKKKNMKINEKKAEKKRGNKERIKCWNIHKEEEKEVKNKNTKVGEKNKRWKKSGRKIERREKFVDNWKKEKI